MIRLVTASVFVVLTLSLVSERKMSIAVCESRPSAQRPRRRKKQSSHVTAALRARPSAKLPHPLFAPAAPHRRGSSKSGLSVRVSQARDLA